MWCMPSCVCPTFKYFRNTEITYWGWSGFSMYMNTCASICIVPVGKNMRKNERREFWDTFSSFASIWSHSSTQAAISCFLWITNLIKSQIIHLQWTSVIVNLWGNAKSVHYNGSLLNWKLAPNTVKLGYVKLGYRKNSDILKLKIGFFRIARWGFTC